RKGIGGWVSGVIALGIGLTAMAATAVPKPKANDIPKDALQLAGAWDITVQTSQGKAYSWLEIEPSGATLVGRFVGMFGSARPISKIDYSQGTLHFTMPPQYEDNDFRFDGKL